jgi:hypothetical protein
VTSAIYRPNVDAWREHHMCEQSRRADALAAFERQREASLRMTRLLQFWISVACLAISAILVVAVMP